MRNEEVFIPDGNGIYHADFGTSGTEKTNTPVTFKRICKRVKLPAAGVKVTTIRYNGVIHDFGLLNPLAHLPQVKSLFLHAAAELRSHLF